MPADGPHWTRSRERRLTGWPLTVTRSVLLQCLPTGSVPAANASAIRWGAWRRVPSESWRIGHCRFRSRQLPAGPPVHSVRGESTRKCEESSGKAGSFSTDQGEGSWTRTASDPLAGSLRGDPPCGWRSSAVLAMGSWHRRRRRGSRRRGGAVRMRRRRRSGWCARCGRRCGV